MKNYLVLLIIAATFSISCYAQKSSKKAASVPEPVQQSFNKKFPGATATWEKEGDQYEADFKNSGQKMSAVFDANGAMTESEIEIKVSELPGPVLAYVKQHYNSAAIKEAAKITRASGEINYEVEVKGKDLLFDVAGKFIKVEKD